MTLGLNNVRDFLLDDITRELNGSKPIATLDCETDPFLVDRIPRPFMWDFFDGYRHNVFWGKDCTEQLVSFLMELDKQYIVYAHNGGNFDFYYLIMYLSNDLNLIKNRIVKAWLGKQELRDSYAIFPDSLATYKKDDFDYKKMETEVRENHKDEIIHYCKKDCEYLFDIVKRFHQEFGDYLTIGSCAMKQLKKYHHFDQPGKYHHETFSRFYYGGRNQCFATGIMEGPYRLYDINGMYADRMRNIRHPSGKPLDISNAIGPKTYFACIEAKNYGCLPTRGRTGSLDFTTEKGTFYATIHEINAGLETGTLQILKVKHAWDFDLTTTFAEFIDYFQKKKEEAQKAGDILGYLFYKRLQNSCYGKMAQDPDAYLDCIILKDDVMPEPWRLQYKHETQHGSYFIFGKPSVRKTYYNIATGASITGASRALLLKGLVSAETPLYCDTDSILCRELKGVEIDPFKMGAWKFEGTANRVAIAGKKLYALEGDFGKDKVTGEIKRFKKAHKGAVLTPEQIFRIAAGAEIEYAQDAPKFRLSGDVVFVRRNIRATGKPGSQLKRPNSKRRKQSTPKQKLSPLAKVSEIRTVET